MKKLVLNKETVRKGWSSTDEFWFSNNDFQVHHLSEIADESTPLSEKEQLEYFKGKGFTPYFTVSNEEVIMAYVSTIENAKIKEHLQEVDYEDYVDTFWKYVNVYKELEAGLAIFEDTYVLEMAESWCKANNIEYVVDFE